ncbi:MAG: ATP-dependent sacrificial sulfur transferase LarE, partial [Nitrospirae bacterium]
FRSNPIDRCYYCKRILYKNLKEIAEEEELSFILDGTNSDDKHDYRPGMKAAEEFGIVSPLLEAGLGKKEIRNIAKSMGLPNWDKPSSPCLATRIPYGSSITEDALRRIEKAENFLKDMGISQCRVRHYDIIASIEVEPSVMNEIIKKRREIIHFFSEVCGYKSVHLDIEGFRSGKLNSLI